MVWSQWVLNRNIWHLVGHFNTKEYAPHLELSSQSGWNILRMFETTGYRNYDDLCRWMYIIRRFQHIPTMSWTSHYRNRWFIGSIQPRKGRPPIDPRHFRWGCQTGCNLPSAPKGRGCLVWSNYFLRMENYGKLNPKISLNHTHCYCIFCSKMHSYPFLWHVVQQMIFVMCWLFVVLCKPHRKSWILSQKPVDASDLWQHMIAFGGELYVVI